MHPLSKWSLIIFKKREKNGEESEQLTSAVAVKGRREKEIADLKLRARSRWHEEDESRLLNSVGHTSAGAVSSGNASWDLALGLAVNDKSMGRFVSSMAGR